MTKQQLGTTKPMMMIIPRIFLLVTLAASSINNSNSAYAAAEDNVVSKQTVIKGSSNSSTANINVSGKLASRLRVASSQSEGEEESRLLKRGGKRIRRQNHNKRKRQRNQWQKQQAASSAVNIHNGWPYNNDGGRDQKKMTARGGGGGHKEGGKSDKYNRHHGGWKPAWDDKKYDWRKPDWESSTSTATSWDKPPSPPSWSGDSWEGEPDEWSPSWGGDNEWNTNSRDGKTTHESPPHDICLQNPVDEYRTCYQRPIDPSFHQRGTSTEYQCETIDREGYNIGALLFTNNKNKASNAYGVITPYTKPYTTPSEELISGTITLSLLMNQQDQDQDTTSTKLDCHTSLKLEETVLTFLSDNIGSESTYSPICVSLKNMIYTSSQDDVDANRCTDDLPRSSTDVTVRMLEFEVTYVTKNRIGNWGRRRELDDEVDYDETLLSDLANHIDSSIEDQDSRELRKETKAEFKLRLEEEKESTKNLEKKKEEKDLNVMVQQNDKKKKINASDKKNKKDKKEEDDELTVKAGSNKKHKDNGKIKDKAKDKVSDSKFKDKFKNKSECTEIQTALCCSQRAINLSSSIKTLNVGDIVEVGEYCTALNCNLRACGTGRTPGQVNKYIDDNKEEDKWESDSWDGDSWDSKGWDRELFTREDVVSMMSHQVRSQEASPQVGQSMEEERILASVGKYSYEIDVETYKYPKKDCPAYSHPKAHPTWYDNYVGDGTSDKSVVKKNRYNKFHKNTNYYYTCPAYGILKDENFNDAIRCLTPLNPQDTYAQLDIHSMDDASYCSINRYSLQEYEVPILTCDEFYEHGCGILSRVDEHVLKLGPNDDLLPRVNEIIKISGEYCCDESTYHPTMFPTWTP